MILINVVDDADWNSVTSFSVWLLKVLCDQCTEVTVCVLEVLEDANEVVNGIFKPGERAFSVGLS